MTDPLSPTMKGAAAADHLLARAEEVVCPHCGGPLHVAENLTEAGSPYARAILRCGCAEYPLFDNILNLGSKYGFCLKRAVRCLREGRFEEALLTQIEAETLAPGIAWKVIRKLAKRGIVGGELLGRLRAHRSRRLLGAATYAEGLAALPLGTFGHYLADRFAMPSFYAGIPLAMQMLDNPPETIVDLGCGAGHYEYLLQQLYPRARLTAIDQHFAILYLAQRFLANPNTLFICLNFTHPAPVCEPIDLLFSSDTFTCLSIDPGFVRSYVNQVKPDGMLIFPRLDQVWESDRRCRVDDWLRLLHDYRPAIIDEHALLPHLAETDALDIPHLLQHQELSQSTAIGLLGGPSRDCRTIRFDGYAEQAVRLLRHWQVSPNYAPAPANGDQACFHLAEPPPLVRHQWSFASRPPLPETLTLPATAVDGRRLDPTCAKLPNLLRHTAIALAL